MKIKVRVDPLLSGGRGRVLASIKVRFFGIINILPLYNCFIRQNTIFKN
jgi:hypothetical protein